MRHVFEPLFESIGDVYGCRFNHKPLASYAPEPSFPSSAAPSKGPKLLSSESTIQEVDIGNGYSPSTSIPSSRSPLNEPSLHDDSLQNDGGNEDIGDVPTIPDEFPPTPPPTPVSDEIHEGWDHGSSV